VLQALRRGAGTLGGAPLALPLIVAVLATDGAVQAMAALRVRWTIADRLYRAVFA
jgi:hypothetical protein